MGHPHQNLHTPRPAREDHTHGIACSASEALHAATESVARCMANSHVLCARKQHLCACVQPLPCSACLPSLGLVGLVARKSECASKWPKQGLAHPSPLLVNTFDMTKFDCMLVHPAFEDRCMMTALLQSHQARCGLHWRRITHSLNPWMNLSHL